GHRRGADDAVLALRVEIDDRLVGSPLADLQVGDVHLLVEQPAGDDLALLVLADRRDISDVGAGAVGDERLVEALAAGIDQPRARQQRLARPGQMVDLEGEVDGGVADHQDGHATLRARSMKRFTRSGSTSFHQTPSRFSDEATMTPSQRARMAPTLSAVTP